MGGFCLRTSIGGAFLFEFFYCSFLVFSTRFASKLMHANCPYRGDISRNFLNKK